MTHAALIQVGAALPRAEFSAHAMRKGGSRTLLLTALSRTLVISWHIEHSYEFVRLCQKKGQARVTGSIAHTHEMHAALLQVRAALPIHTL